MTKRRNASAIVVLLLLAAVAVFFFVRKHGASEGTQAASPPETGKAGNPAEQAAPPAPQPPAAPENANGSAPSDESNAAKQASPGQGAGNSASARQPKQAGESSSKKADEPASENKDEAKKDEKKDEEAKNAASKQATETKPAPVPTGNLSASFTDQVGVTYRLISVSCTLDGVSACGQSHAKSFSMFNRKVDAGVHRLQVSAVYEGAGGPFAYANGYRFTVKSGRQVTVDADRSSQVNVMVHESGGATTPMEQRLRMAFNTK